MAANAVLEQILAEFFAVEQREPRRVLHGRGQCYPGLEQLCVDWFPPVLLFTLYEPVPGAAAFAGLATAADTRQQLGSVLLQRRHERGAPSQLLWGEAPGSVVVEENGLRFEVQPGQRQNAGLFLDMRPLRQWLQVNSRERRVLNLFAYTCSLSVAALAGGAGHVTNVDMSRSSLEWGKRNHGLNGQAMGQIKSVPYNVFKSWGRIIQFGRYDLVLIDPPTRQRGSFDVEKNYGAVLKKLPKLCNPGAEIIATLNSPFLERDYLLQQFASHAPGARHVGDIDPAPEFRDRFPERGLKICRFRWGD